MSWLRPLYQKGHKPFLFYAVFGKNFSNMNVSKEKHGVGAIPPKLQFLQYDIRIHSEYITAFYTNALGEFLREKGDELFRSVVRSPVCLILTGEVEDDSSFAYFKSAIGLVEAALEQGAAAVLDLQTFHWYTPEEWHGQIFAADDFYPHDHISMLLSPQQDGQFWLHTRGMRKMGRPDISVKGIPETSLNDASSFMNRLIELQAMGIVAEPGAKVIWRDRESRLECSFRGSPDDPDFNNVYVELHWSSVTVPGKIEG